MQQRCANPRLINNDSAMLSDNSAFDIVCQGRFAQCCDMKRTFFYALCALMLANGAQAACYADYKAKKDDPLQLHYGVVQLPQNACSSPAAASQIVAQRLAQAGWTLLNVVSVFDDSQLAGKKANAGQFFLRF